MSRPSHPFAQHWNHNTHYYPTLDRLLPTHGVVLDAGCGDGTLAEYLARHPGRKVIGADVDPGPLPAAMDRHGAAYLLASLTALPLGTGSVDAVVVVMALHHVPAPAALAEVRRVLRPGGELIILGLARTARLREVPAELLDAVVHRIHGRGKQAWEPDTTKLDPTAGWTDTRRELARLLPGCRWRRLPMWRYLCRWRKPAAN